jgi:hypothetical protein
MISQGSIPKAAAFGMQVNAVERMPLKKAVDFP